MCVLGDNCRCGWRGGDGGRAGRDSGWCEGYCVCVDGGVGGVEVVLVEIVVALVGWAGLWWCWGG